MCLWFSEIVTYMYTYDFITYIMCILETRGPTEDYLLIKIKLGVNIVIKISKFRVLGTLTTF